MASDSKRSVFSIRSGCSACNRRKYCLPSELNPTDVEAFSSSVVTQKKVAKGLPLFNAGDPADSLHIVRLGSLKSSVLTENGTEQVVGFRMSGEILGAESIAGGKQLCSVTALEDSEICSLRLDELEKLSEKNPKLSRHLYRVLSKEIAAQHRNLLTLGSTNATNRLAAFLLNLSQRFEARGFSRSEFVLRMTRAEIGSFLGLKLETVSRTLSRFTDSGLIEIHQKHVHIIDQAGLEAVAQDIGKSK